VNRVSISFFILGVTSIVLILLGLLTAVSGLCLVKPGVVEKATAGLLTYAACARLHLYWSIAAIFVAVVHGVAGLDVWLSRLGLDGWWLWPIGAGAAAWFIYMYLA